MDEQTQGASYIMRKMTEDEQNILAAFHILQDIIV